jgi:ABC-type phosphate/phosphonate transport system ATPase subunit
MKEGRVVFDGPSSELTETALRNIYGSKSAAANLDGTSPLSIGARPRPAMVAAGR